MRETMTNTKHSAKKLALSIFSVLLIGAAFIKSGTEAAAQNGTADNLRPNERISLTKDVDDAQPPQSFDLTGTWLITITPDDGSPSFTGYYSFFADGNASFSSAGPPIPGLGNPGYGVWEKVAKNRFAATIRMNSYTETFQFDGTLKISAKIRMTGPDTFVTQDTVKVYDPAGNEIVTLGGSARGERMKVED